ncbi:MAG: hypothetical protein AAB602_01550 [Patescibacteria group bacterium]
MNSTLQEWPGEIITLSDGTRNAVGLDRPWQNEMAISRDTCPFCAEERPDADRTFVVSVHDHGDAGKWKVRRNKMTPFPFHRLILPLECYHMETLWNLGGERNIAGALHTAISVIHGGCESQQKITDIPGSDVFFFVHVGYSAGQRFGHEHWHLIEPPTKPTITPLDLNKLAERENLVVFSNRRFTVIAGGCRAGQCYIIPDNRKEEFHYDYVYAEVDALAQTIHRLVTLFNKKFTSAQGLKPDFQVFLRFDGGKLVYAKFIPILNMWGVTEYAAIDEHTPFVLPWPHEATVQHLSS